MKRQLLLIGLLFVAALSACEDTDVHTTPPAPVDGAGAPTVTIDPPTVGPNMAITVTGQGFPADTVVELTVQRITESFRSDPLAQGQTDAAGNVTIAAQVPALWLDGTPLSGPELTLELATEDGDVRGVATVPFEGEELDSFLTIVPSSGAPGQQIQAQGVGFAPGLDVAVGHAGTTAMTRPGQRAAGRSPSCGADSGCQTESSLSRPSARRAAGRWPSAV
ncbi:MAG: hypothetical protein IPH95_11680 [Candidatus Promineofilum sp.]|nr:hypothetical protein [Promineifilum sp.]